MSNKVCSEDFGVELEDDQLQLLQKSGLHFLPRGWKIGIVSDYFELGRGRVISRPYIHANPGNYPVFSSQSQNNGEMGKIATYDFEGNYFTWTTDGAYAGSVFFRQGRFNCTNVCGTGKAIDESKIDAQFASYYLATQAKKHVSYVGNPKLMNNIFAQIPLAIPPLPEQKKIAKVLSGIDCLLEKVNSLYSKQKILTRAISIDLMTCGIGQKNFIDCKQGKTPDDWSICTLGSIFSLTSGRSKPKNLLSSVPTSGSEIPVYGGNGITGYATDSLLDSPTVTIGRVGEYCGAVHLTPKQSWVTDNALYINKKVSEFDLKFMYYFLDFCDLSKLRKQGGQPLVSQKPIMELEVALPPIEEQRRIACAMDSIAKNFSDLQILNHKIQGLKMSISTDLLSGRKRVSI